MYKVHRTSYKVELPRTSYKVRVHRTSYYVLYVQVILDQNDLTGLAGGVIEGQNIAQNAADAVNPMQNYWLQRPVEAPKWVKDTRNGPQMVSPIDLSLFPGFLTYIGACRGFRREKL